MATLQDKFLLIMGLSQQPTTRMLFMMSQWLPQWPKSCMSYQPGGKIIREKDREKLETIVNHRKRWGFILATTPCVTGLTDPADTGLLRAICSELYHVLHGISPPTAGLLRFKTHEALLRGTYQGQMQL